MKTGVSLQFDASVTLLVGDEGLTIHIYDDNANILLCEVKLGPEETCSALGRHAYCKAKKATAYGLDRIGKYRIVDNFKFDMPEHTCVNKQAVAVEEAQRLCPDGWEPDLCFDSQNSFFTIGEKTVARTCIRSWVNSKEEKDAWESAKAAKS